MQKKSFIKFLKKLLLIIIPIYIIWIVYIESMPMYYNQPNNTRWYFIKQQIEGKIPVPDVNIIFLGESRVNAAVNFNEIPNSYSFASGGSTSIEMYYILKRYTEIYGKPDTVFLSISPRFLSEVFAFYPYAVRNDLLSFNEYREIMGNLSKTDTTLGNTPMLKYLLYKADYIGYYQSDVMNNFVFGARKENNELISEMKEMKGGRIHPGLKDSCSELNYETTYRRFTASPILDIYFEKILSFSRKEGIFLIFDFIPVNESSYRSFRKDFLSDYKKYILGYKKKYPEFIISNTVFFYEDACFGDNSHLNYKGKERYTNFIKEKYFSSEK